MVFFGAQFPRAAGVLLVVQPARECLATEIYIGHNAYLNGFIMF